jgi:hypothetical protein
VINSEHELVYEEAIYVQFKIRNLLAKPIVLIKPERLRIYDGALQIQIFNDAGTPMRDSGRRSRPPAEVRPENLITFAPQELLEGTIRGIPIKLDGPGKYRVRAVYRPNWKSSPEIVREFSLNVIALGPAIIERKSIPGASHGQRFTREILKLRTADGCWLFAKNSEEPVVARLVQVSEKATFTVSERRETDARAIIEVRISEGEGAAERVLKVDYEAGTLVNDAEL